MDVRLETDGDPAISEAVRASAARTGLVAPPVRPGSGAWWRAGLVDALERAPGAVDPSRYDAARSPRSTRGATRA